MTRVDGLEGIPAWYALILFFKGPHVGTAGDPPPQGEPDEEIRIGPFRNELEAMGHLTGPIRNMLFEIVTRAEAKGALTIDAVLKEGLKDRLDELMNTKGQRPN